MKSWKTTTFGIMAAIGGAVFGAYEAYPSLFEGWPTWIKGLSLILSVTGTALVGLVARDNNVTSEQAGATKVSTDTTEGGSSKMPVWILAAMLGLYMTGCATLDPKADPIEVRAEQVIVTAADTMDLFLKTEYYNHSLVMSNAPAAHDLAQWLREPTKVGTNTYPRDVALVISATNVRRAYKANRSDQNKASLLTALATLEAAMRETQDQMAQINLQK